jgi:hypothetical protein
MIVPACGNNDHLTIPGLLGQTARFNNQPEGCRIQRILSKG